MRFWQLFPHALNSAIGFRNQGFPLSGCLTIKQEKQKDPPSDLLFFFCALEDLVQKPVALRLL